LYSDEPISAGEPGSPAVRGRATVEQHFIPKLGLVREVRIATLGSRLSSKQEITRAGVGGAGVGGAGGAGGGGGGQAASPVRP
jgi:hypothetical protein